MRVSEWMSPDPVVLGPEDTVQEARALLRRYGIRHLPVVDRGRVVGVLSDRDVRIDEVLLAELTQVPDAKALGGGARSVSDVMSSPAHVVAEDETMEAAARLMLSGRISALPVVDAERALVGLVTTTDCLARDPPPQPRTVMTGITVERALGRAAPDWLAGDPALWLPQPVRRSGPDRWTFPVRGGPFSVPVSCRVGDVWRREPWASRSLSWGPVGNPDAALDDERLLPRLHGELTWSVGDEGRVSLRLRARYEPPGGVLGRAIDRLALHRVADQTLRGFLDDVCRAWPVSPRAARPASPRA